MEAVGVEPTSSNQIPPASTSLLAAWLSGVRLPCHRPVLR